MTVPDDASHPEFEDVTLPEVEDKTDKKLAILSRQVSNGHLIFINEREQTATRAVYIFTIWWWLEKLPHESRYELFRINHSWDYEDSFRPRCGHQDIIFLQDPKNQGSNPGQPGKNPLHLNLHPSSKQFLTSGGCEICKEYFLDLDHFELSFDEKDEYEVDGKKIKFLNLNSTMSKLFSKLKEKKFLEKFPYIDSEGLQYLKSIGFTLQ
jgi:hypothetical protein